jgi:hypothetical protein
MTISCFPRSEEQLRRVVKKLVEAGFLDQYEEQAHGERVLLSVRTTSFEQRESVKEILQDVGISDFNYSEDTAA